MRIPLFGYVYKVRPAGRAARDGWKGWRLWYKTINIRESCDCVGVDHFGEPCECKDAESHTHSGLGSIDMPLRFPRPAP